MRIDAGDHGLQRWAHESVEHLLTSPEAAELPPEEEAALLALLRARGLAPAPASGRELLAALAAHASLPTGCAPLDALLRGGLRQGALTEVCGATAAGKTQLCLAAAAAAAAAGLRVELIDTSNAFDALRLVQLLKAQRARRRQGQQGQQQQQQQQQQQHAAPPDQFIHAALSRVRVTRAYALPAVLAALDALLAEHGARLARRRRAAQAQAQGEPRGEQQRRQQQQDAADEATAGPPPALVIVDSLGAAAAPVLGGGGPQGHALVAAAAGALKAVAAATGAAALATVHLVAGGRPGEMRPALGETWKVAPHARLLLAHPHVEGGQYVATLLAGTLDAPGGEARYWLGPAGLQTEPPPPQPDP